VPGSMSLQDTGPALTFFSDTALHVVRAPNRDSKKEQKRGQTRYLWTSRCEISEVLVLYKSMFGRGYIPLYMINKYQSGCL
jgi:hypothetical protein